MSDPGSIVYRCAPTVCWVKDTDQTILVEEQSGHSWSLRGLEAVVWDLVVLKYPAGRIVEFLAALLDKPLEVAREELRSILQRWEEIGLLKATGKGSGGQSGNQRRV